MACSGDGGDDARAHPRGHLRQQQAHAAGAGMHQRRIPGLERKGGVRQVVRGHALQHGGGGLLHAQPLGNLDQLRGGNQRVLGITAHHADRGNRIAGREARHARAQFLHRARGLAARSQRQSSLVDALAEVDFDEVDPDSLNADQNLARSRLRDGQLGKLQNLWSAGLMNLDGFHDYGLA